MGRTSPTITCGSESTVELRLRFESGYLLSNAAAIDFMAATLVETETPSRSRAIPKRLWQPRQLSEFPLE